MEKLVFSYYETDECSYGNTHNIPFEYGSKEDFENYIKSLFSSKQEITLFGFNISKSELEKERIEIHTLENWWTAYKNTK